MSLEEVASGLEDAINQCDEILSLTGISKGNVSDNLNQVAGANEELVGTATGFRAVLAALEELLNKLNGVFTMSHPTGDQAKSLTAERISKTEEHLEEVTSIAETLDSLIARLSALEDEVGTGTRVVAGIQDDLRSYLGVIAS